MRRDDGRKGCVCIFRVMDACEGSFLLSSQNIVNRQRGQL